LLQIFHTASSLPHDSTKPSQDRIPQHVQRHPGQVQEHHGSHEDAETGKTHHDATTTETCDFSLRGYIGNYTHRETPHCASKLLRRMNGPIQLFRHHNSTDSSE